MSYMEELFQLTLAMPKVVDLEMWIEFVLKIAI